MNTFDRHRQYLLRKQRKRLLLRRALTATGSVVTLIAVWTVLAKLGPERYAPPDPAQVGVQAAKTVARTAVSSINTMDARLRPDSRENAKRAALRLFENGTSDAVDTGMRTGFPWNTRADGTDQPPEITAPRIDSSPPAFAPSVPAPAIATPAIAMPAIAAPAFTAPAPAAPSPAAPAIAAPALAAPALTAPAIAMPALAAPALTAPAIAMPAIAAPAIAAPAIAAPEVAARVTPSSSRPAGRQVPIADSPTPSARTIDILLIGVDSRLGRDRGRADALHLLTVDLTAPRIRITSIPRGTPSRLGYRNEASNIISNVRAARGRGELQRRIARMCERDSVPYYVEIGFSDAYGIIELLGFEDPAAEFQALRRRKGYQYGDHNRCYNQGMFIRGAILRMLPLLEGATGELLMRAGLDLVHTNLTLEQCRGIVYLLNDAGLSRAPSLVDVMLRSPFRDRIERKSGTPGPDRTLQRTASSGRADAGSRAEHRIRKALAEADAHRGDARRVRGALWTMFIQHAWLQMKAGTERRVLRDSLAARLAEACTRLGDQLSLDVIRKTLRADDQLFTRDSSATRHPTTKHSAAMTPRAGSSAH